MLELGAGSHALPSCASSAAGASAVVATDKESVSPALAASLAAFRAHNPEGAPVAAATLEFGGKLKKWLGRAWGEKGAFDVLLLSELLSLTPALFPALLKTVTDASPRVGVLLAFRPREGFEWEFLDALAGAGYALTEVARGSHGKDGFCCTEAGLEGCDALVFFAAANF